MFVCVGNTSLSDTRVKTSDCDDHDSFCTNTAVDSRAVSLQRGAVGPWPCPGLLCDSTRTSSTCPTKQHICQDRTTRYFCCLSRWRLRFGDHGVINSCRSSNRETLRITSWTRTDRGGKLPGSDFTPSSARLMFCSLIPALMRFIICFLNIYETL